MAAAISSFGLPKFAPAETEPATGNPSRPVLFTNVQLFDGKSSALHQAIRVLVDGNRIKAVAEVISDDGYVTMGGPDEATHYVTECGPAWRRTPGAVAWLTKLAATLTPKRRTRATMH
jgi:hypothetical protein